MGMTETIDARLREELSPSHLVVTDDSHHHIGHAGYREGGESHFSVEIVSEKFAGVNRVNRQRMVHELLKEELASTIHALQIKANTSAEINSTGKGVF
ncbi:BolA family transcriptional regulator [Kiloniella spongiae]|uniref:BolA family transcriptional regulator n=1 Tax=Kiloniella spongiae TaxID=1489064 RepID=A0A0H2MB93_9PROT|nr:BolA family protein [Kiloniella spongiae]KLN59446.1 BolA family transcriptional regulator [Kiloniella spongiae]